MEKANSNRQALRYRKATSSHDPLDAIEAGGGNHFDPKLVDLSVDKFDAILDIQKKDRNLALWRPSPQPTVAPNIIGGFPVQRATGT